MKKAIYKITNKINNKIYIGQSCHPDRRWKEHCANALHNIDQYPIHLAIKKYGKENFLMEVLEWTENYNEREQQLIQQYNTLVPNGYNVASGGSNRIMYGEDNPKNRVKNQDLPKIIQDFKENKLTDRKIAKKYHLTDKIIADINHGYSHKIPTEHYPLRIKRGRQKLTEEQANQIKYLLKNTSLSYNELAKLFNVTKGTIYQINRGTNFNRPNTNYPIRGKNK